MHRIMSSVVALAFSLVLSDWAWAKPAIIVEMTTAREVRETVNDREVRKIVPVASVEPGQVIIYTLRYRNDGDEKATNVVINNPVPPGTVYLVGSASGAGSEISFSIDGGMSFKQPTLLTYEISDPEGKVVRKVAAPEEYTNVQWLVREILPGQQGEVTFQVRIK